MEITKGEAWFDVVKSIPSSRQCTSCGQKDMIHISFISGTHIIMKCITRN